MINLIVGVGNLAMAAWILTWNWSIYTCLPFGILLLGNFLAGIWNLRVGLEREKHVD